MVKWLLFKPIFFAVFSKQLDRIKCKTKILNRSTCVTHRTISCFHYVYTNSQRVCDMKKIIYLRIAVNFFIHIFVRIYLEKNEYNFQKRSDKGNTIRVCVYILCSTVRKTSFPITDFSFKIERFWFLLWEKMLNVYRNSQNPILFFSIFNEI